MVEKTFIGVREVDEETFRKFRAKAMEEKLKVGYALTLAMKKWLREHQKEKEKSKNKLPRIKPFSWGRGTEKTSKEIDNVLYEEGR